MQILTYIFQGYTAAAGPGFPRRGTPTQMGDVNLWPNFAENCMKMKTIGGGGAHP